MLRKSFFRPLVIHAVTTVGALSRVVPYSHRRCAFTRACQLLLLLIACIPTTGALAQVCGAPVTLEVCPWDYSELDGDRITVMINDTTVFSDVNLGDTGDEGEGVIGVPQCMRAMGSSGRNTLTVTAQNTGREGPNTPAVTVRVVEDNTLGTVVFRERFTLQTRGVGTGTFDIAPIKAKLSSDAPLRVKEGETAEYTVELTDPPTTTTMVTITSTNPSAVTVAPSTIPFDSGNWDRPMTVTVQGRDDEDGMDATAMLLHRVNGMDGCVEGDTGGTLTVQVMDDDTVAPDADVIVDRLEVLVRPGESETVYVHLTARPLGEVTVARVLPLPTGISIDPPDHVFTVDDYDTPKPFTVSGNQGGVVRFEATGGGYDNVLGEQVTVRIDDVPRTTTTEEEVVKETVQTITAAAVSNLVGNIGTRFSAARAGGSVLTFAGQPVQTEGSLWPSAAFGANRWTNGFVSKGTTEWRGDMSTTELLRTSAFQVSLGVSEEGTKGGGLPQVTFWGRGDVLFFDVDSADARAYDGDLKAGYLGADAWLDDRWLAGVALSRTGAQANYGLGGGGNLELSMTGVHPYARFAPNDRRELWVILGAGFGEIEYMRDEAGESESSDVKLYMGAAGVRQALAPGNAFGIDVALLGDVGFGHLEGDSGTDLEVIDELAVDTLRIRVGVEGSYTATLEKQRTLTPFVEVAGRYDGGNGDDETGLELAGGLAYADPTSGLGLEARANVLALYSQSDYREYGASLTASLSPRASGEGLSLSLTPRLGRKTEDTKTLWRDDPFVLATGSEDVARAVSLDGRIGYGIQVPTLKGLVTPFGQARLMKGNGQRLRTGVRFNRNGFGNVPLTLEVFAEQSTTSRGDVEEGINIIGKWRF